MSFVLHPWQLFFLILSGFANRQQQEIIEFQNAQLERYMRSMKSECLGRMILFGQRSLERALKQFIAHYHGERNHQGLGNKIIDAGDDVGKKAGDVRCRERLGGMLRYYHCETA